MKDEIKEIKIKTIGQLLDYVETEQKVKELINYITNLQEENQKFKNWINVLNKDNHNYKSRNEKALNKIQYIIDYGYDYDGLNTVESLKGLIDMLVDYAIKSRNILNGGDDNE